MAYKKGGYKKNYRKNYNRGGLNRRIKRIATECVKKNIETKSLTMQYSSVGIDPVGGSPISFGSVGYGSSALVTGLGRALANGTADGQRIGNKALLKGVYIRFNLAPGDNSNNIRFMLVRPKGQVIVTSVASFVSQLLSNQGSSGTQWLQPIDTDIWYVKMDWQKFMRYEEVDTGVEIPLNYRLNRFIKFPKGLKLEWNQGNNQPATDLYLVAISDSAAIAHPGVIAGFVKLYYTDA